MANYSKIFSRLYGAEARYKFWGNRMRFGFRHMEEDQQRAEEAVKVDDPPGAELPVMPAIPAKPQDVQLSDTEYDMMRMALARQTNPAFVEQSYIHALDVARWCMRIARKRGLDEHEACLAGFLHDIYYYATGLRPLHAQNSAEQARLLMKEHSDLPPETQQRILHAILSHEDPGVSDDPLAELTKDAHLLSDYTGPKRMVRQKSLKRLASLVGEWKLIEPQRSQVQSNQDPTDHADRYALAEVAQTLASQRISWYDGEPDALTISKYWPEEGSFSELKEKWCAAFVYHCCYESGFRLPLRADGIEERFSSVKGWLHFASALTNGFYHPKFEAGFTPERGDIVIFDRILEDKLPADHMGVVVMTAPDRITVAEGNARSSNVSDVIEHSATHHVRGYIRLPNDYRPDRPAHR